MHSYFRNSLIACAAIGLVGNVALAAPKSRLKERGSLTVSATLQPTASAPVGSSGSATIEVSKPKFGDPETAELTLTTAGLAPGSYSIDAKLQDLSTVHLGDLVIDAALSGGEVVLSVPTEVDASKIGSLTISDSSAVVQLEGAAAATINSWKLIANVQVTGAEPLTTSESKGGPKPKRVHGHALAKSFIDDDVETKRQFLWVAKGAAGGSELTINVNGLAVATVTSTADGKVMFAELPETVVLREIDTVTITDAVGAVVMQAQF